MTRTFSVARQHVRSGSRGALRRAGPAITSLLFGVSATDALTLVVVLTTLAAVAVLASLLPALHATKVDPVRALRVE